jgi:spore germination cell wall hydrolase CwlJ-like protein
MKLFNNVRDVPYRRWAEGFLLGAFATMSVAASTPVQTVEVEKIVEKPVVRIEKVPVYLNQNDRTQIQCMTENAYFEAKGEPTKGIIAVNNVVLNRVNDNRFPNTPCGVINQRTKRVCQFSWKCERGKRVRDWNKYNEIRGIVENVYLGNTSDVTRGAKFYHADYVKPYWSKVFQKTTKIGAHIFYRG